MQAADTVPARVGQQPDERGENRDWIAWYDDLREADRREIRNRLVLASYDEVKADPELRNFFFFHSEDVAAESGGERLAELHEIIAHLRGATEPDLAEKRRKAVAFLLAAYQAWLRDNPWNA